MALLYTCGAPPSRSRYLYRLLCCCTCRSRSLEVRIIFWRDIALYRRRLRGGGLKGLAAAGGGRRLFLC
jgi:hypothetical protein